MKLNKDEAYEVAEAIEWYIYYLEDHLGSLSIDDYENNSHNIEERIGLLHEAYRKIK